MRTAAEEPGPQDYNFSPAQSRGEDRLICLLKTQPSHTNSVWPRTRQRRRQTHLPSKNTTLSYQFSLTKDKAKEKTDSSTFWKHNPLIPIQFGQGQSKREDRLIYLLKTQPSHTNSVWPRTKQRRRQTHLPSENTTLSYQFSLARDKAKEKTDSSTFWKTQPSHTNSVWPRTKQRRRQTHLPSENTTLAYQFSLAKDKAKEKTDSSTFWKHNPRMPIQFGQGQSKGEDRLIYLLKTQPSHTNSVWPRTKQRRRQTHLPSENTTLSYQFSLAKDKAKEKTDSSTFWKHNPRIPIQFGQGQSKGEDRLIYLLKTQPSHTNSVWPRTKQRRRQTHLPSENTTLSYQFSLAKDKAKEKTDSSTFWKHNPRIPIQFGQGQSKGEDRLIYLLKTQPSHTNSVWPRTKQRRRQTHLPSENTTLAYQFSLAKDKAKEKTDSSTFWKHNPLIPIQFGQGQSKGEDRLIYLLKTQPSHTNSVWPRTKQRRRQTHLPSENTTLAYQFSLAKDKAKEKTDASTFWKHNPLIPIQFGQGQSKGEDRLIYLLKTQPSHTNSVPRTRQKKRQMHLPSENTTLSYQFSLGKDKAKEKTDSSTFWNTTLTYQFSLAKDKAKERTDSSTFWNTTLSFQFSLAKDKAKEKTDSSTF